MKKIISLFKRNYDTDRLVRNEVVDGAEWVVNGWGLATRKLDGTACMIRDGQFFKRYDCKAGRQPPSGFEPTQDPDPVTHHWPGWVPIGEGPEDKWQRDAISRPVIVSAPDWPVSVFNTMEPPNGTYELLGPKVQRNHERQVQHVLIRHAAIPLPDAPRDFHSLKVYFQTHDIEGIVWHHPDGRMVKIKARDFGLKRGA